ncbi:MAG TPA: hypothetical protein VNF00_04225, partial [Candidatus Acidoferrales bacterium]|nr:hypothetical protein [Candidatus Acidoferrales bacterium]
MAEDQGLPFRLDITLGLAVAVMTIWLVLSPPTTRFTVAIWLCVLFSLAVYPVLHLASWFSDQLHRKVYAISVVVWAGCVFILGWHIWPRPRSDLGPQIKPAAVVEIAGYDNLFNSGERQITSFVHAKNIGPGISRDVQGIVWIGA